MLGFVTLIIGVALMAPTFIVGLSLLCHRAPLAIRLPVRDLARYRSRSSSSLAAISIGVLVAVVICVAASARYANVLDYAGPNLSSNELLVYAPQSPGTNATLVTPGNKPEKVGGANGANPAPKTSATTLAADIAAMAKSLGTHSVLSLETANVTLSQVRSGSNNWNGALYVATPGLLKSYGITSHDYSPDADILSTRPGLPGEANMVLSTGGAFGPGPNGSTGDALSACTPAHGCIQPVIDPVNQLPGGVSAPNTVVTDRALTTLHAKNTISTAGWLLTTPSVLTASQISAVQSAAAADGLTIETKNDEPNSWQVVDWATVAGIALALAVLAMTIGLLRSETASDLRTLAATGASSFKRRSIAASTAGAMALLGAVLGTTAGYLACAAFFRTSNLAGQSLWTNLSAMPASNLLIILVGMPLVATLGDGSSPDDSHRW